MVAPIIVGAALSAASLAIEHLPSLARFLVGKDAGDTLATVTETIKTVTGVDNLNDAAMVLSADPGKATEFRLQLARIQADREAAREAHLLERLRADLAGVADARARDTSLRSAGKRNVRADVMVGLCVVAIMAGMAFLASGLVASGSDAAGALIGLIGLFSKCFADAFQFEFGSSRGSADKTAATERLTTALVDRQAPSSAPIINQPTGTVLTGATADELNTASLRAARGG